MTKTSDKSTGRKKHEFPSRSVRVYEDVYDDAMLVSAWQKKDMAKFLSELLRPLLVEMKKEVGRDLVKGEQPKKDG